MKLKIKKHRIKDKKIGQNITNRKNKATSANRPN